MALTINHNLMALNTTRNLNAHYQALAVSTRRLSSGLRVGTAADDAAGLAIRELMRADISAMNQGVRNANDAVSMLQVADGGLQIIDEKLIRMKELAEQAATGTYGPEQRAMIDSEYQAMAKEITRIANSTDFNGIYLLNGNAESNVHDGSGVNSTGKIKIHFGPGNSSAEDYYYIQIGDSRAEALSIGNGSTFDTSIDFLKKKLYGEFTSALSPLLESGKISQADYDTIMVNYDAVAKNIDYFGSIPDLHAFTDSEAWYFGGTDAHGGVCSPTTNPKEGYDLEKLPGDTSAERYDAYQKLPLSEQQKYNYAFGRNNAYGRKASYENGTWTSPGIHTDGWSAITFPNQESKDAVASATTSALNWYLNTKTYAGQNIASQENAQMSLDAINQAIAQKDTIRANIGALQNRLENTISNLQIQAENLQASESRISDVDVAQEMTNYTQQQVLSQAAVAMLSQANSLPQMALQLIQGK